MSGFAGVVLAAGRSTRFGESSKLLAPLGGRPLVCHAVRAAVEGGLAPVIVVIGGDFDLVRGVIEHDAPGAARFLCVPEGRDDLSDTLRAGLSAVRDARGVFVLLADMPFVSADLIGAVASAWDDQALAAAPVHRGRRGHPVLLARRGFALADQLKGDRGLGAVLAARASEVKLVDVETDACLIDIDTPADLESARARFGRTDTA